MKVLNKNTLSFIAASCIMATSLGAKADTMNITVNGDIVASTCVLANKDTGKTIELGKVSVASFSGNGSVSGIKNFDLQFSECNNISNINIAASGQADDVFTDGFKSTGTATNVAIKLTHNNNTVSANGVGAFDIKPETNGTALVPLQVSMVQAGSNAPGQGSVTSVITLNATYS